jgi:hypothetical protein
MVQVFDRARRRTKGEAVLIDGIIDRVVTAFYILAPTGIFVLGWFMSKAYYGRKEKS